MVSNHASYLDSLVLAALLPTPVSFVAKAELQKNPVMHFYLRRLDTEFVDRWNKERRPRTPAASSDGRAKRKRSSFSPKAG